jgi:hypothetical protein
MLGLALFLDHDHYHDPVVVFLASFRFVSNSPTNELCYDFVCASFSLQGCFAIDCHWDLRLSLIFGPGFALNICFDIPFIYL